MIYKYRDGSFWKNPFSWKTKIRLCCIIKKQGWLWPGEARDRDIGSHGIELVIAAYTIWAQEETILLKYWSAPSKTTTQWSWKPFKCHERHVQIICKDLKATKSTPYSRFKSYVFWLPAWWALWLLWWPLTDAAMFQCVFGYLQSVFFFLVLFHCCILLNIKLTTTTK